MQSSTITKKQSQNSLLKAKKVTNMSAFSYTFESILSNPQEKKSDCNRKRRFCEYSAKAQQCHTVVLWGKYIIGEYC